MRDDPSGDAAILTAVSEARTLLLDRLEAHYRDCGWKVQSRDGYSIRATGPGGVTWIGMAVAGDDLADDATEQRLLHLSDERMDGGRIVCPFELLPDPACADDLRTTLERLQLAERGHVTVYSAAA